MAEILDVCTLPQEDMQWEEIVTIHLEDQASFPLDEPHIESRNDGFTDLNMQINDGTTVNVDIPDNQISEHFQEVKVMNIMEDASVRETLSTGNVKSSDNEINENFREFKGMSVMENANLNQAVVRVDIESLDSKISDGLLQFTGINMMENANLRQAVVAALSRGICEDISEFHRKQNSLYNNVQGSPVDNRADTDGSVGCQPDARADARESLYPFAKVKTEGTSFPFAKVKTEGTSFPFAKVKTEEDSFPFAHIKTEHDTSDTDTAYSSGTETTLESQTELQPYDDLGVWDTGSSPTVIKKEPGADDAETHPDQPIRNGLQNQQLNNIRMGSVSLSHENMPLDTEPYPVTQVKSIPATNTSLKNVKYTNGTSAKAKAPVRKVQKNATSKAVNSQKHCLVCNAPCLLTENKKLPILPFCGKCKRAYAYQRGRSYVSNTSICRSRGACRIDYRQEKICPRCHYTKFLAILSAAQRIFKEPFQQQICRRYSHKEASKQKKHDWSIIRDQILLQEALSFQPRVLLTRIDDCNRRTSFEDASKIQRCGTTSAIHERNIKLIRTDQSATREPAIANLDGMDIEIDKTQREVPSVMSPDSLLESISETSRPIARSHLLKDMFSQRAGVDPAADRFVSRYSGRVIRRKNFRCDSYDTLQPVAKTRYTATKRRKTTSYQPSKVSMFICGHVCGACNDSNADKWLSDHGYAKALPLSHIMSDETQPVLTAGTPTKDALVLNKLYELNQLLQGSSNVVIELTKRPMQPESQIPTLTSIPSVNVPAPSPAVQNTSNITVQKSSTLGISSTTVYSILSEHDNSKNARAEVTTSLRKSSPHDLSSEMMKTSQPTISTRVISNGTIKTLLQNSSEHEMTRIAVETSAPKSSLFEISRNRIGTLIPKMSPDELSCNTFSTFLPKMSPHELSSNTFSTFPPKLSPHELSSNTMPNSSAHEILSGSKGTFLSRISLPEISSNTINTFQPQISALGISSDTISTSLSDLPNNEIVRGAVKTSYESSSNVIKTSLPQSSTHEMQSGMMKTVLPTYPVYAVPSGAVSASAPNMSTDVLQQLSSQHLQEQISPAASQPVMYFLVPISNSVQQLPITPDSMVKQSQQLQIPPQHFFEKQSLQLPVPPPHSIPEQFQLPPVLLPHSTVKQCQQLPILLPHSTLTQSQQLPVLPQSHSVEKQTHQLPVLSPSHSIEEQSQQLPVLPPHATVMQSQQFPVLPPSHSIEVQSQQLPVLSPPHSIQVQSQQLPVLPPHATVMQSQQIPILLPDSIVRQYEHIAKYTSHIAQPLGEPPGVPASPEASSILRSFKVSCLKPKLACLVPVIKDQKLLWHLQFNANNA